MPEIERRFHVVRGKGCYYGQWGESGEERTEITNDLVGFGLGSGAPLATST